MPFCGKCGTQYPDDFQFCPKCGAKNPFYQATGQQNEGQDLNQTIQREGFVYGVVNLENLPAGHIIDERYEIKEKLGQGGFGAVYLAYNQRMQVDKAIKVIPEALTNDVVAMDNLRQEARTMIRLKHPNIVHVYDLHESKEVSYIDMEFIDGQSLAEYRISKPDKILTEAEVKKIALQIAEGLSYAHSQNVIHRDIKPQNIMLTKDGKIKIMDFGIAETLRTSMSMIQNTSTTGTLMYMSPEQLSGEMISRRSDIYSLGATLYELLNGKPPFYSGDITYQILQKEPQPIEHVSKEMNAIVLKCLQKDQYKRFQSCEALKKALLSGTMEQGTEERRNTGQIKTNDKRPRQRTMAGRQMTKELKDDSWPLKADSSKMKWIGIAVAAMLVAALVLAFKQGWFSGGGQDNGIVTLETMKDASWEKLSEMNKKRVEALLKDADNLFIRDKLVTPESENAYTLYKKVLKIHSGNKYALAQLDLIRDDFAKRAKPYVENKNYDAAENIVTAGLGYFPGDKLLSGLKKVNSVNRLYVRAQSQFKQQQPEAALSSLNRLEEIKPDYRPAMELKTEIGSYYLKEGDRAFAQKNYGASITLYKKAQPLLADEGSLTAKIKKAQQQQQQQQQRIAAEEERRRQLAEQRKREEAARIKLMTGEMVYVKGGTFQMGSNNGDGDEKPVHTVTVSDFYIGKYEVTQKQWKAVMGSNPSHFKGDNRPVEEVSWNEVQEFIRRLNAKTGGKFRLPTEAEWEYAARGGAKFRGYKYAGSNNVDTVAWYSGNSGKKTHTVGQKKPNELGLYDMSGNVWEWCADWYGKNYYSGSPRNNPKGPDSGTLRVFRGGSWYINAWFVRVALRNRVSPDDRSVNLGFRLVRTK